MDTARVRTFLEIARCGSFIQAAERLNVTQTTVSARVRALEDELGRKVFIRNRSGARLTPAGAEFLPYAESLMQVWQRARRQIAVPIDKHGLVALGGELSLWNPLLQNWMIGMRRQEPDIAIHVDVGLPEQLMDKVRAGVLDVVVMYAPRFEPGLEIEQLFSETLILVRSPDIPEFDEPGASPPPGYIYVDWGEQFAQQHAMTFPGWSESPVHVRLGPLALGFITSVGGCGFFRQGAVQQYLATGQLIRVPNAPLFEYPAYAVYAPGSQNKSLRPALHVLKGCL